MREPDSAIFRDHLGQRQWVSAQYQPDGSVYLLVPRDGRYWDWHKAYWNGVPEYAREKDYLTGLHWVLATYADSAVSVMQAYYPEVRIIKP